MYLEKKNPDYWAIDVEGDPIPSTRIWVITCKNVATKQELRIRDYDAIRTWFEERIKEGCKFIAHNGIGYDFPTLNRICGTKITMSMIIDTMVMSMLYSPSLEGGHSLEAWAKRLGMKKGDHKDFSQYSPEMEEYCMDDTRILTMLYICLRDRMISVGFTDVGLEIEHYAWQLIQKQRLNGFAFNIKEAHILYAKLRSIEDALKSRIEEFWPPRLECLGSYSKAFKKDGTPTQNYTRHRDQYVDVRLRDDGGYDGYGYVHFNIGSPPQRVQKLTELGWTPYDNEWNVAKKGPNKGKKTSPKTTKKGQLVPSLIAFIEESGREEVRLIAQWIDYNARGNMINTWIEAYDDSTGCIHGSLWLANTLRYRHSNPNTANIPAVRLDKDDKPLRQEAGVFTYEARDLWTVRDPSRVLVGVDAKGIQLRVLANYLNNSKFTEAILSEDPHAANRDSWGFSKDKEGRALAKTIVYATLMGAGDARIMSEAKLKSLKEAQEAKRIFFAQVPELPALISRLKTQLERTGRIELCDGSRIMVSSPHMVIPYLLQGDESRIMKKAMIITDLEVRKRKLDVLKVGDIHDEWQNDVLRIHSAEFADGVCPVAFRSSGEFFQYRLPIECDSKLGMTWAQTH